MARASEKTRRIRRKHRAARKRLEERLRAARSAGATSSLGRRAGTRQ